MSNNEITWEERERIIKLLKDENTTFENFDNFCAYWKIFIDTDKKCSDCGGLRCSDCFEQVKNKILKIIESAPTEKNMKAVEFADKLEKTVDHTNSLYGGIAECLGYDGSKTFGREDVKRLCNAIRNLDTPANGMQWPLDRDGEQIKPNDKVYYVGDSSYLMNKEFIVAGYRFTSNGNLFIHCLTKLLEGESYFLYPKVLVHNKPRTLEDIKREILIYDFTEAEQYKLLSLINEAHEIGKKAVKEEQ